MFLEAYQSSPHSVYFGKNPNSLQLVTTLKDSNICPVPKLVSGETYYWRVDSEHKNNISQGPLWSFKVGVDAKKLMHDDRINNSNGGPNYDFKLPACWIARNSALRHGCNR